MLSKITSRVPNSMNEPVNASEVEKILSKEMPLATECYIVFYLKSGQAIAWHYVDKADWATDYNYLTHHNLLPMVSGVST